MATLAPAASTTGRVWGGRSFWLTLRTFSPGIFNVLSPNFKQ